MKGIRKILATLWPTKGRIGSLPKRVPPYEAFPGINFNEATPIVPGQRIIRPTTKPYIIKSIDLLISLPSTPLALELGQTYVISLHFFKKGDTPPFIVVVDIARYFHRKETQIPENLCIKVIGEGEILEIGREIETGLTIPRVANEVSRKHLTLFFPEKENQLFLIDYSKKGTTPYPIDKRYQENHRYRAALSPDINWEKIQEWQATQQEPTPLNK